MNELLLLKVFQLSLKGEMHCYVKQYKAKLTLNRPKIIGVFESDFSNEKHKKRDQHVIQFNFFEFFCF